MQPVRQRAARHDLTDQPALTLAGLRAAHIARVPEPCVSSLC
jgi:hypothetical protein